MSPAEFTDYVIDTFPADVDDHVRRWVGGELAIQMREVLRNDPVLWFATPNSELNGIAPRDVVAAGGYERVRDLLNAVQFGYRRGR